MTDLGILSALHEQCNAPIRFFDLVKLYYLDKIRQAYLCVGKHGLFFLNKRHLRCVTKEQLYYEYTDKYIENITLHTDLCIRLSAQRPSEWSSDTLWIRTFQRQTLVDYIHVAWCTDRMVRYGRAAQFPLYKHHFKDMMWGDGKHIMMYQKIEPFIGYKQVIYCNFSFYLRKFFHDRVAISGTEGTGNYIDERGIEVTVHVHDSLPIIAITEINHDSMAGIAGAYRKSITEVFRDYKVISDGPYNKKFNLADDPCFWVAWEIISGFFLVNTRPVNQSSQMRVYLWTLHRISR